MIVRALLVASFTAVLGVFPAVDAAAQAVTMRDMGPHRPGRQLRDALSREHVLIAPDTARVLIARGATVGSTLVVLGRDVYVEGRVRGDVFVVGGDLFMRPGALIEGRGVAIGGGAYPSTLAAARGELHSHRDFTYDVIPVPGGFALDYRALNTPPSPFFSLPMYRGFRVPRYDRTNGATVFWGPLLALDTSRIEIEPLVAYRSQLGEVNPTLRIRVQSSRRTRFEGRVERATFTNDAWITSHLVNSATVLVTGKDTRNYWRGDRAELRAHRVWEGVTGEVEPYVGVRVERALPVRPTVGTASRPWSLRGSRDTTKMLRPNPQFAASTISSVIAGARLEWESQRVRMTATLTQEVGTSAGTFAQTTLDARVDFPAFGSHTFLFEAHAVATALADAPMQRWAYLGGSGTLPFLELLERGGDQLIFLESRYTIPIDAIDLPIFGIPTLSLRHIIGGAGTDGVPRIEQNLGLRAQAGFVRAELLVDPPNRKTRMSVGLSLTR